MAKSSIILLSLAILLLLNSLASCSSHSNGYVLNSGHSLKAGGFLVRGMFNFTMQHDCNLVLYEGKFAIWSSRTNSRGSKCSLVLKNNGDLLVRTAAGKTLWRSKTGGEDGHYVLVLKSNGNVVVYGDGSPVWSTSTLTTPPPISGDKP